MTETVSGTSTRGARKKGGLKIERVFSTEGVHPYDELTWERRDVVQQNWKTGAVVFEQRGVEFPDRGGPAGGGPRCRSARHKPLASAPCT
jgi:ribonucleoside-diphosphate reductase alpha chain